MLKFRFLQYFCSLHSHRPRNLAAYQLREEGPPSSQLAEPEIDVLERLGSYSKTDDADFLLEKQL